MSPTQPSTFRYGEHRDNVVEVWPPTGAGRGTAAVIHGGWWRSDKDLGLMRALCAELAGRGWWACNVEYRRIDPGPGGWPATFDDVCAAITSLDDLAGPAARVAVGHSAGGQLAMLAAAEGLVAGAVGLAPVTDLRRCARAGLGEAATPVFLGAEPDDAPDRYRSASPIHRIPRRVPQLLVHGDADERVPVEHSRELAAKAEQLGAPVTLEEFAGAKHLDVIDPAHASWQRVATWLAGRVGRTH